MTDLKQYRINAVSASGLVSEVEAALASGALAPGQPLPSVRRLAVQTGLSPATVAAGLAELRRRGVVVTEPRRGSRIGEIPKIDSSRPSLRCPPGASDLSLGNPDPRLLPDLASALRSLDTPVRMYGEPAVLPALEDLARELLARDGMAGEWLCVTSGALDGIERVLGARLRSGDRVAVENPGYASLFELLRSRGMILEPVAVDEFGMRPEELAKALDRSAKALIITPRGQNPTGAAMTRERAGELRAVLDAHPDALVIEDDHLGEVADGPLHSLLSEGSNPKHWAATRSVAKALGPDLRLAILTGDHETIARVQSSQAAGPGWVSHILQRLVLALLCEEGVRERVAHARETYARRREHLLNCLRERDIQASGRSGLNVWIPVAEESIVIAAMLSRGWLLAPGRPYRLADSEPAVRVTISTLTDSQAPRLALDLAHILSGGPRVRSG
ncbi:MAG TPA: aminotransferase class I/II-fold pyridoxal phosphate-dependent enzyme [Solirubrobacteraceae bacterium]